MSFTDQKPRIATLEDTKLAWSGAPNGKRFRCYLCNHKFQVGDIYRFVYNPKGINIFTCVQCDGDDVLERFQTLYNDVKKIIETYFWIDVLLPAVKEEHNR